MTKLAGTPLLEVVRVFDASPERIFDAWLDRTEWQRWIGPEGVTCDVPELEPVVGGRYRLTMHLPDGGTVPVTGVFAGIERPSHFAFTWGLAGDPRETLVTVTLRELGSGRTELTLRQEGLPTAADVAGHTQGWSSALNKLAAYLAVASETKS